MHRNRVVWYAVLFMLGMIACNRSQRHEEPALKRTWYKRYKGTIGKDTVMLNLYNCVVINTDDGLPLRGGTWYYKNGGTLQDLSILPDSSTTNVIVMEDGAGEASDNNSKPTRHNRWKIMIQGSHVSGTFFKANSSDVYNVWLDENYENGYYFNMLVGEDSVLAKGTTWTGRGSIVCAVIEPRRETNPEHNTFIVKSILADQAVIGGEKQTIAAFIKGNLTDCLLDYKASIKELQKDSLATDISVNSYDLQTIVPVYNDKGMLVVKNSSCIYMGGAHPMNGYGYVNMDVYNMKVLALSDILKADSATLTHLLNTTARNNYKLTHKEFDIDLEGSISLTDNFYIDEGGVTFSYSPYEVAGGVFGEIKLFLSYATLRPYLRSAFVARMGISL